MKRTYVRISLFCDIILIHNIITYVICMKPEHNIYYNLLTIYVSVAVSLSYSDNSSETDISVGVTDAYRRYVPMPGLSH